MCRGRTRWDPGMSHYHDINSCIGFGRSPVETHVLPHSQLAYAVKGGSWRSASAGLGGQVIRQTDSQEATSPGHRCTIRQGVDGLSLPSSVSEPQSLRTLAACLFLWVWSIPIMTSSQTLTGESTEPHSSLEDHHACQTDGQAPSTQLPIRHPSQPSPQGRVVSLRCGFQLVLSLSMPPPPFFPLGIPFRSGMFSVVRDFQ